MGEARDTVQEWVQGQIKGRESIVVPELTQQAITWLKRRKPLREQLADELFYTAIYELVRTELKRSRETMTFGDEGTALTAEAFEQRVEKFSQRFLNWYERAGDRHVQVMDMTREDLQLAAAERRDRGEHEYQLATLWDQLAADLEGGQAVKERFTSEEVEGLYEAIRSASEGAA